MKLFNQESKCPKCASTDISTRYELGDYLMRICRRCGYWWHEESLDKKITKQK